MLEHRLSGSPILVDANGNGQFLAHVDLTEKGKGQFDEIPWLQKLIHASPECLPIADIEPGLGRFFSVCREMPVAPAGYLDNLLMTPQGDIAIVETELFRNPEARRARSGAGDRLCDHPVSHELFHVRECRPSGHIRSAR